MKAGRLKEWMTENDKSVQDIASLTKVHPNTIYKFLKGEPVTRSIEHLFELLLSADASNKAAG